MFFVFFLTFAKVFRKTMFFDYLFVVEKQHKIQNLTHLQNKKDSIYPYHTMFTWQ